MKKFSWKTIVYPAAGGAAVMLLSLVPAGNLAAGMDMGLLKILFLLAAGMVAAVALVLPGISVSYLLLLLGTLTTASAASLLVFCLLYTPCVAAVASIKRELGGKWALAVVFGQLAIAWIAAFAVYHIALLF